MLTIRIGDRLINWDNVTVAESDETDDGKACTSISFVGDSVDEDAGVLLVFASVDDIEEALKQAIRSAGAAAIPNCAESLAQKD
jgi:hypothetical protein